MTDEKKESIIDLAQGFMKEEGLDVGDQVSSGEITARPLDDKVEKPNRSETTSQEEVQKPPAPSGRAKKPQKTEEVPKKMDTTNSSLPDILDDLLKNVKDSTAWTSLELPSRGIPYSDFDGSTVEIKAFTYQEEKLLRSIKNIADGKNLLQNLFNNCVRGISYGDLTIPDKTYILFMLRRLSYGEEYPLDLTCTSCNEQNHLNLYENYLEVVK